MARNNGLSLVARLNISLSESQINDDLKKISDSLNDKSLPSFIAHINVQGSAAAINKELESLGKKLKVDFGKITEGTNKGKLKEAGKKVAQQVYNVHELKAAGQDYLYNANDIQKQIDQLQSRYDKRNVSLQNSVNVSALTNEVGQVKALRVEYENLEHQMVRVDYIKAKFDNKEWGFVSTGANYIDKTEGKAYQETLSYMTKIESSFRKIHDSAIGFSSPIKEGSKFFDEYNAKAGKVAQTITEIRSENKILSDEQKTYISSLVSSFEAYVKNLKEAAKGATSLSPKNLSESIKQSNAELNTMLKNLTKNKQETGFLGNEYKKIYEDISGLRTQLNSVTNGEEFALYSANLKLVREGVKQYNSDVANSTANQKLKSDMDDVNAKIMTFIRENKNLTDSYKQNLLDLAGKANQAKSGFELKGISGQANALMNAYTKSEDMSRSIRTLNSSLTISEQKLLEMQNDTVGLDVEFQRLVDRTNQVRTNLGDVSTQSGIKNVKVEVAETKQAINDLYNTWQSRQIANQKMVANQTLNSMSEKLLAQRNDLYGLDTEYRNFSDRIVDIQNRLATTTDKIGFNRISAEISTLNSQLNGFYNQINARQGTTLFNENVQMQMVKIDQNARSVSSSIARNQDLMHQYEQELNRVWDAINNITSGTEVLSQTQQMEVRRLVENFKMYETELQNIAKTGLKPNLQQNISVYNEQLTSMLSKLNSMSAKVPDNLSNGFNNVRATIRQLQNELGSVTEESDLTNFIVNFKILNEQFNQLSSAVNGQTTIDNLTNKISTLDTKMEQYLRTVTNIAPAQRVMLEDLRNQLNASFTIPEFESIKTQWDNLVTSIATEQQRISGIPLEEKLVRLQSTLVALRTDVVTHRTEIGNLGIGYEQLIDEIDTFITRAGSGAVTSIDEFNLLNNEVGMLQDRIRQANTEIGAMQRTTLFNEGIETQLNKIDANARSVSSHLARDNQLMAAYEAELTNVRSQIDNITNGTEILSQTQQTEIRRIVENFRLYEAELQNVAKENLSPTLRQDMSVYSAEITSMISKLDAMATKVPETMSAQVNAFRNSLVQLRTQVGNVTQESDLTNISVNFKLAREEFSQLSSAVNGDNSLDNLINKIATLDTEMDSYLRTTTNITQVQRETINDFRDQLAAAFTMPDFERIRTEYTNFIKSIATEQQRIGGVPLEDKLLHTQEVLVTLRTSVIAHQQEVGSLGSSYGRLISEIDRFITGINNGAITSKDDFEIMENSIGQLQERIKQTGIEIKSDLNFLSVNNSVRTLVSDINTYLANNLNLPERFRQQAEAIVYELNHTTDKITFDDLKVRWHELVSAINSEVIKVGGVDIAEKVNTGVEALNVLRQTLVSQKGVVGNLDGTYRELLTDIDNLKLAAQNIYSPDQYNAWANDAANVQKRIEQLKNSISSTTGINQLAVQAANLSTKINLFISENSRLSENAKTKLRELANQAQQAQSKMDLSNINTQFNTFTMKLKEAGRLGTSIIDKLKQNISKFSAWFGMTTIIMRVITLMRQMITNVKELDTAMVNLKKVTDETDQSYQNFFKRAGESAQELHADMTNLIDATAEFAKLGYSIGEAEELAKSATVYRNVGELDSIQDATESIVSTMKAFKVEANDAMQIVDKFNKVGKSLPIRYSNVA
ncbi:MAG: phage tail tape measure protein [Lachnospiraceae bacterium]|nr:phage tail tape measure protein [Lachnospiraceae bacterium]